MTKSRDEIIAELGKDKVVEEIVHNIAQKKDDTLNDLIQDIYVDLLLKPSEKIEQLYDNNQLKFFITKMVLNNVNSKNSPYYYKYKKFLMNSEELKNINIIDDEETY